MGRGLWFVVAEDPGNGGFNVRDTRDGRVLAWRYALGDVAAIAAALNGRYPAGSVPPAHDSLVFEIALERIEGEAVKPLSRCSAGELQTMIPDGVDDRPALWKPGEAA